MAEFAKRDRVQHTDGDGEELTGTIASITGDASGVAHAYVSWDRPTTLPDYTSTALLVKVFNIGDRVVRTGGFGSQAQIDTTTQGTVEALYEHDEYGLLAEVKFDNRALPLNWPTGDLALVPKDSERLRAFLAVYGKSPNLDPYAVYTFWANGEPHVIDVELLTAAADALEAQGR